MTANNAKSAASANAAKPSKAKKQARTVGSDRTTDELSEEIGNVLRKIDAPMNFLVSRGNRSKKEKAEIKQLLKKQRTLRKEKRDLSSRDAARLGELRNEREIAELANAENIAEKEQAHPYEEQIDELTSERLGRPLVWEAIHEPEKLLARINRTSNRKNQKDRAAQDSAAKSYDRLSLIFWRIGTELASTSPEGWAEELLANPDITLLRLEAFVKGCAQLRGDAPRGAKIERELVTLEEEPFLSAEAKRRGVTVAELRREVQQAVTGGVLTLEAAGKFGRQIRKKADDDKVKRDLRRKST